MHAYFSLAHDDHIYIYLCMRTTIDMPDALMHRVKMTAAQRKTTFRALVVEALERTLDEPASSFELKDASVGSTRREDVVSSAAINELIDQQREARFHP